MMPEPIVLTDETIDKLLLGDKPALILLTTGDGLRGDFSTAFKKATDEQKEIIFARIDPLKNPKAAARFGVSDKPLLIGWYCGEEVVRRSRPWGTDVPLAIEMMQSKVQSVTPVTENKTDTTNTSNMEKKALDNTQKAAVDTKPVVVTDATFQTEVIDYHLPVVVDFWAPWCGPCRAVAPVLEKLAAEYAGQIRVAKVNTDENPGLSQTFQIMSIPTIMLIKERTIVFSQPGALPESAFRDLIKQLIALKLPPKETQPGTKQ
jgi:thioredoxin